MPSVSVDLIQLLEVVDLINKLRFYLSQHQSIKVFGFLCFVLKLGHKDFTLSALGLFLWAATIQRINKTRTIFLYGSGLAS